MRKSLLLVVVALLLTGCSSQPTFETVTDVYVQPAMAQMQQMVFSIPSDAAIAVLEDDTEGTIYLCDGYTATVHSTQAGDLDKTLRETTGFTQEDLRFIQTQYSGITRTEGVWTAAGEGEDQMGRFAVLDDGNYHYVLTCMAGVSKVEQVKPVWEELFASFRLEDPQWDLNTGS